MKPLRTLCSALLALATGSALAQHVPRDAAPPDAGRTSGAHLFVWSGDAERAETDFLAVVDADPASPTYARVLTTLPVGVGGTVPHHTDHALPADGVLWANGFATGQLFRFDLREPLAPRLLGDFVVTGPFMHPHSFARLPDGHALATLQMRGHANAEPGALVELDAEGRLLRTADAADPDVERFIRPYSLAVVPALDRVVTTSADMHVADVSHVVQVWRLSDLTRVCTVVLPPGPSEDEGNDPAEPRVLDDGRTVLVSTFSCGLYRLVGLDTDAPSAEFVYHFGGGDCALPVVAGRYWVQTVPAANALVSLDVSDPAHPCEVGRLTLGAADGPHWIALDPAGRRIVISGGKIAFETRILIARIDPANGQLSLDESFREKGFATPGVSFDRANWPHGATGKAIPHGAVFSRPSN